MNDIHFPRTGLHVTTTVFAGGTIIRGFGQGVVEYISPPAIAVRAGRIVAEGAAALSLLQHPHSERVDLDGRVMVPAFGDGHAHPLFAGLETLGPAIRDKRTVDEIVEAVRVWGREHPHEEWILGGSYDATAAPGGVFDARWLDEADDRPIVLRAWDYHTVWVNTAALRLAGIDANTPEPALGAIARHVDGRPIGTLRETGAVELVMRHAPQRPLPDQIEALRRASANYLAHGFAWVQEAWVDEDQIPGWIAAAEAGALAVRFNLAFRLDPRNWRKVLPRFLASAKRIAARDDARLTAGTVKFFVDGVIENRTAALLSPYRGDRAEIGPDYWSQTTLQAAALEADAAGFQLHFHAIGDRAVRQALDAIEHVESVNGARDRRPVIAHVQLVHPDDVRRFARLGVIANFEPLWTQLDENMLTLTFPQLEEEHRDRQFQIRTLLAAGAPVSFGSDWPVTCADWRTGLDTAVSRLTIDGEPAGGWMPQERIDMVTALDLYTRGSAYQAFADDAGTIAVGNRADLVLLDADPTAVGCGGLSSLRILATWIDGIRHDNDVLPRPTLPH